MAEKYVRQHVEGFIIKALQSLGGSASKNTIKEEIVADDSIDITYSNVFEPILSKNGEPYIPFNLDFGFGLINLHTCGYIDDYVRRGDITLTEKGRTAVYSGIPTDEDKTIIKQYWDKKDKERLARDRNKKISVDTHDNIDSDTIIEIPSEKDSDTEDDWRVEVLEQISIRIEAEPSNVLVGRQRRVDLGKVFRNSSSHRQHVKNLACRGPVRLPAPKRAALGQGKLRQRYIKGYPSDIRL